MIRKHPAATGDAHICVRFSVGCELVDYVGCELVDYDAAHEQRKEVASF
jgi:hypothetical protein